MKTTECRCQACCDAEEKAELRKELAESKRMNVLMAEVIRRESLPMTFAETVQIEVLETRPIG